VEIDMALRLEDIELIKRLKYRYCTAIDTCDTAVFPALFTEDVEVDYVGGSYRFQASGKAAVIAALTQAFNSRFLSSHTVHHPIIDVHDDDTADGRWTLVDYNIQFDYGMVTSGSSFYVDKYVKRNGEWLIRASTYSRLYERVEPVPGTLNLTAHYLATKGDQR
jgi:hypothetical protein